MIWFHVKFIGTCMYVYIYIHICVYVGSKSLFMQVSLKVRWDFRDTRNIRLTSSLEVFKTVLDNHFITARFTYILPRTFRHIHTTSSAILNLKVYICLLLYIYIYPYVIHFYCIKLVLKYYCINFVYSN